MAPGRRLMTPRGQMSGMSSKSPIMELPEPVKALFEPRPVKPFALVYKRRPEEVARRSFSATAVHMKAFEDRKPAADAGGAPSVDPKEARRRRRRSAFLEKRDALAAEYDPSKPPDAAARPRTAHPERTMFVARLSPETSDRRLRRECGAFGDVTDVVMVSDRSGRPKGYAFVEFQQEGALHAAVSKMNGRLVDGSPILCDYERARTKAGWLPQRLGGGARRPPVRVKVEARRRSPAPGPYQRRGGLSGAREPPRAWGQGRRERDPRDPRDQRDQRDRRDRRDWGDGPPRRW